MKKYSILVLATFLILFSGCDKDTKDNVKQIQDSRLKIGQNLTFKTTTSDNITLTKTSDGFKYENSDNKTTMLFVFTTWCAPCKAQIPYLNNLQNRYNDNLKIIGVLVEGDKPFNEVENYVNSNSVEFSVTYDANNMKFLNELGEVKSLPYMVIYDKDGNYKTHYTGAVLEEMIEADLKRVF
ncbi:MAG: TlpA family protein disulfide reductase [Campylobacteraceae bacterium]